MGRKRKYHLDESYFEKINTINKAYVLGFIFADGSVYNNYLTITVSNKDYGVLEFIKNELRYDGPIYNKELYSTLSVSSKIIVNDLMKFDIIQNKTYKIKTLPMVNELFFEHFLLGFFDGDGSIYKSGSAEYDYTVNFSNNKETLNILKIKLLEYDITSSSVRRRRDNDISCMLDIRGSFNLEKIFNLLYRKAPDFFLSRKRFIFNELIKSISKIKHRKYDKGLINEIKNYYLSNEKQINISTKLGLPASSVRCVIQRLRRDGEII